MKERSSFATYLSLNEVKGWLIMILGMFFEWIQTVLVLAGYVSGSAAFPKPLTKEEEKKYLQEYAEGSESAKNILIERNLRLVAHIAKKYADEKTMEDLISIGTIGLIKGINTFRPDKSSKLSTYISRCIENEVLMYLRSAKKLRNEVSIDESIGVDREGNNMTFSDILTNEDTDVSDIIFEKIEAEKLRNAMKKALNMNEMNILTWRYGLDGRPRKTQREVAKILGISRSYVSRIEKKCLQKLAAEMEDE